MSLEQVLANNLSQHHLSIVIDTFSLWTYTLRKQIEGTCTCTPNRALIELYKATISGHINTVAEREARQLLVQCRVEVRASVCCNAYKCNYCGAHIIYG